MVRFGEQLAQLQQAGWEKYYVDYEDLKAIIDRIEASPSEMEKLSGMFAAAVKAEINKVDRFVSSEVAKIRSQFASRDKKSLSALKSLDAKLSTLRRFVGTNIIAATKIVKKHDKHVSKALAQRNEVGSILRTSPGMAAVPELHKNVSDAMEKPHPQRVAITFSEAHDDESEEGLRSLPGWLLGEKEEAEQGFYDTFYSTYLSDWNLKMVLLDERKEASAKALLPARPGDATAGDDASKDKWNVDFKSDVTAWQDLSPGGKMRALLIVLVKTTIILLALYAFICSLSFLADGFRLVAGRQAGEVFRNSEVFNNPVAGMLVGVLVTVLVQSSSTSTSIVITMVAAELLSVRQAINLIMGANIGTSVTSTIVALAQSGDRDEFRRAFAAATVHDMFNFLTVAVLLPLEAATGYLFRLSEGIISLSPGLAKGSKPPDILKAITKPFTKLVMSVDKKVITKIAVADTPEKIAALDGVRMLKSFLGWGPDDLSDGAAGVIILIIALAVLCVGLFIIVATLKSLLKGRIAVWLHQSVNGHIPDIRCGGGVRIPMKWLTGYLAMGTGLLVTIAVQSSSITTSALTPLVGVGVINVERMYPTVLGANIGTCITGVLAALAADASKLYLTLQVAYAHLLFNISGILIWYVIWPLRAVPINAAKFMGATTAVYRWFAVAYLIMCFFVIPAVIMGISIASTTAVIVVIALALTIAALVLLINVLQARRPLWLPARLRTWTWLPEWMRSLAPMDRVFCAPLGNCLYRINPCKRVCGAKKGSKRKSTTRPSAEDIEIAVKRMEQSEQSV